MDDSTRTTFNHLWGDDRELQNQAFHNIMERTVNPVDWAYEVWDEVVDNLTHSDNHNRAIASQLLSNLAKSDPQKRILEDLEALITVTKDERFVTARHCLQSLWKIGLAGKKQQKMVVSGLEQRYRECESEKNCTLIRYDIIQGLKQLFDQVHDENIEAKALELIDLEQDEKYRKKYAKAWRK